MKTNTTKNLAFLFIFTLAMGFLEAIVVIYLRHIYYPDGFSFPLRIISNDVFFAEFIREITTMIMLFSISFIAGKNRLQILAYLLFSFAVWDIFYYVALKLFLNWPSSFLTWDILFLIPTIWVSPMIAPVICALTMILLSIIILLMQEKINDFKLTKIEWFFLYLGALLIFITFIWDYLAILISNHSLGEYLLFRHSDTLDNIISTFIPCNYNWILFIIGIACIYFAIFLILYKSSMQTKSTVNHRIEQRKIK